MNETKPKSTPRDFFLNLLSIITLYFSATSFGALVFGLIDKLVPDVLDAVAYTDADSSGVIFAIASLFVIFPVYVWTARYLEKEYKRDPRKKEVSVRRWLVYLTLFVAALAIIGDLVALVLTFLRGVVTTRFILKVLTILFIAGSIFYYYISGIRNRDTKFLKTFKYCITILVGISVLASFFVVGSPIEQRARRFDEKRVQDLQFIQSEVAYYWQKKGRLPAEVEDINDSLRGVQAPMDPETGVEYGYRATGDLTFTLCAIFGADFTGYGIEGRSYPYAMDNWDHGVGEVCFERTIDPDFYKDATKPLPL